MHNHARVSLIHSRGYALKTVDGKREEAQTRSTSMSGWVERRMFLCGPSSACRQSERGYRRTGVTVKCQGGEPCCAMESLTRGAGSNVRCAGFKHESAERRSGRERENTVSIRSNILYERAGAGPAGPRRAARRRVDRRSGCVSRLRSRVERGDRSLLYSTFLHL